MSQIESEQDVQAEVRELRARVRKLESTIEELQSSGGTHGQFDHHDAAVLDVLADHQGTTIDRTNLKKLYRKTTNLRRSKTIHNRVTDLVASDLFESAGSNVWRFVGSEDEYHE